MTPLSLRPYTGKLYLATSVRDFEESHKRLFKSTELLRADQGGRFIGGCGKDGLWTYLIFARNPHYLAHELAHVILHVFSRCGIHPCKAAGEPFCYMLSQLMLDAQQAVGRKKKRRA